jgi:hypothetical protein
MKDMSKPSEVLVYINADGSGRELTDDEKKYVDTEFSAFDGARPYIKTYYEQRNGWGELNGYLKRTEVPEGVPMRPAPPPSPEQRTSQTPQAVADAIIELMRKQRPA